ncbi:MAG: hypothetical protein H6709_12535 [Kofleriaceae bacterium]|nr:hypothetical protein [Myxococcales bacterium]MCB9563601.1 hypothetical protein [Kofleriaceae bacterium]MCB9572905.1 hypothetical protein [Kofleriaceae bacterium]
MHLPAWITLSCATMVLLWGAYRIKLGVRSAEAERQAIQKKGLFGLPRRTHLLIGVIYLLLGGGLIAVTLGWNPLAGLEDRHQTTETTAPATGAGGAGGAVEIQPGR